MKSLAGIILVSLVSTAALAGCFGAGCSGSQGMGGQSGVCNSTDHFSYGAQGGPFTKTESWSWENTQERAQISWGSQGSGSIRLTVKDADGKTVFSDSWSGSGQSGASDVTSAGEPGTWTITAQFVAAMGQLGFTLRAAD